MRTEIIGNATLYLGDCREVLPGLTEIDSVITDPVWPNVPRELIPGWDSPYELFAQTMAALSGSTKRLVVQLGCNSDPRILKAVPEHLPFMRTCWLEYATPHYSGRILNGGDVAYAFGRPIASQKGRRVLPGKSPKSPPGKTCKAHPCSRSLTFLSWLVWWFSDEGETVLDPTMGSGTTGIAALSYGRKFVGIEIESRYFDLACQRIEDSLKQAKLVFG